MSKEFTIHQVPFLHLYRDLSFRDFFNKYDPWRDGKVHVATYSFSHKDFDFWAKLLPGSIFYIDQKYKKNALEFLKRYPSFEVYSVFQLHSKIIFFEKSGVLLLGSENLYAPDSSFSEVMMETFVHDKARNEVCNLLFGNLSKELLLCKYGLQDIRIYKQSRFDEWTPFLPCNIEVDYWSLISNTIVLNQNGRTYPEPEFHRLDNIRAVFDYTINNSKRYLAVNGGYQYCGDLEEEAFNWLIKNCEIEQVLDGYSGGQFPSYHPMSKGCLPSRAIWLGLVKNHEEHNRLKVTVEKLDITRRKIRECDSLSSYLNNTDI